MKKLTLMIPVFSFACLSCKQQLTESKAESDPGVTEQEYTANTVQTAIGDLILPAPYATKSIAKVYNIIKHISRI